MRERLSPTVLRGLGEFLRLSPSLALATCDAAGRPEIVRAGGARLMPSGKLRVLVPFPEGARSIANISATGRAALTGAMLATWRTLQVKGTDAVVIEWPEHVGLAQEQMAGLGAQITAIGWPLEMHLALWSDREFRALELTPTELYEQTPGPGAGLPVKV
jgi:hypothetical protein